MDNNISANIHGEVTIAAAITVAIVPVHVTQYTAPNGCHISDQINRLGL